MIDSQSWLDPFSGVGIAAPLLFDNNTNPKPNYFEIDARLQFFIKFKGELESCSTAVDPSCDPNNPVDLCAFADQFTFGAAIPSVSLDWTAAEPFTVSGKKFATKASACMAACTDQLTACLKAESGIAHDAQCLSQQVACNKVANS